ncbi:hypothetical protein B0G81_7538 [Paraburkholderia sp. BL6665CI2N2]|nr:hypothetical protein [Paraburkholderia sp. BL6665CI2N2]TDY27004.1 hypothetical protein B0G81_7538 [Paraburkholderia sp. BL6665CI2N2]
MNLMTVYFLNSWLPLIMKDNHFSLANAALRFGGILGVSIGAVLLGFKWSFGELFLALSVPIGLAIIAAYIKGCHDMSEEEAVLRGAHGR